MSDERAEQFSEPRVSVDVSVSDDRHATEVHKEAGGEAKAPGAPDKGKDNDKADKAVSQFKLQKQNRLPALEDDGDVGVQKEHIVTRDGKADLLFTGTLLASAAPASAPKGQWQEYRIYKTHAGKHVFSKV